MINVKKEYEADLMMFWYCTKEEPELVIGITTVKGEEGTPLAPLPTLLKDITRLKLSLY